MPQHYSIGQRVKALSAIDVAPYAVVSPGETGTVTGIEASELGGYVSVLWDISTPRITDLFDDEHGGLAIIAARGPPRAWPHRLKIAAAIAVGSFLVPAPWNWTQAAHALAKLTDAYLPFAWPF